MDKIFEKFDYNWLIDTGINLGKGRQGLVRLMLLGGHDYVAVKIMKLSQKKSSTKNRFCEESILWKHLAKNSPKIIPRLYATKIINLSGGIQYGIIVTEVGIPLREIFSKLKNIDDQFHVKNDDYETFFNQCKSVKYYTDSTELPFPPSTFKWLQSLCQENSEKYSEIKQNVFESLKNAILPGLCEANVVHRDIKLDNFIYLPRSDSIVICDFGVSVIKNDEMKFGPRGKVMDREHKQFWNSTQASRGLKFS